MKGDGKHSEVTGVNGGGDKTPSSTSEFVYPAVSKAVVPENIPQYSSTKDGYAGSVLSLLEGTYNQVGYHSQRRIQKLMDTLDENYFVMSWC